MIIGFNLEIGIKPSELRFVNGSQLAGTVQTEKLYFSKTFKVDDFSFFQMLERLLVSIRKEFIEEMVTEYWL